MTATTDLRAFLIADAGVAAITTSVHVNRIPEDKTEPWVWIRKSRTWYLEATGEARRIDRTDFDIECVSSDLAEADQLRDAVADALEAFTGGELGSETYTWCRVEDQFDDYVPRSVDADEALHVCAVVAELTH